VSKIKKIKATKKNRMEKLLREDLFSSPHSKGDENSFFIFLFKGKEKDTAIKIVVKIIIIIKFMFITLFISY
jgi:hypothetical protein